MNSEKIKELIAQGEGLNIEFKSCSEEISSSVYETVCSFLNRTGGHILMGVADDKRIIGVNEVKADALLSTFITTLNNGNKIAPNIFVKADIIEVDRKKIIYAYIQEAETAHHLGKKYFDRNKDADLDITDKPALLSSLFLRKSNASSESRVIPYLQIDDLDDRTFILCRNIVSLKNPTHTWINMSNEEILYSLGLFGTDPTNGERGLKLAALLLFGKEESIASFYPIYRIEGIYRDCSYGDFTSSRSTYTSRYNDRIIIRTNLILAYQSLIEFITKYLPDKFFIEEGESQRTDLRISIFREIIANLLVHREYSSPMAGTLEIFTENVITKNWNKQSPLSKSGIITIDELVNCTKNPSITKTFQKLGWVEELGSGIRNIKKYAPLYYSRSKIIISNEEIFVFDMTYHTPTDNSGETTDEDVKTEAIESSKGVKIVNKCVNAETLSVNLKIKSVNEDDICVNTIVKLPSENLETIKEMLLEIVASKINNLAKNIRRRMSEELLIIYTEKKIDKASLLKKLEYSASQMKGDLRVLIQYDIITLNHAGKSYSLSKSIKESLKI